MKYYKETKRNEISAKWKKKSTANFKKWIQYLLWSIWIFLLLLVFFISFSFLFLVWFFTFRIASKLEIHKFESKYYRVKKILNLSFSSLSFFFVFFSDFFEEFFCFFFLGSFKSLMKEKNFRKNVKEQKQTLKDFSFSSSSSLSFVLLEVFFEGVFLFSPCFFCLLLIFLSKILFSMFWLACSRASWIRVFVSESEAS